MNEQFDEVNARLETIEGQRNRALADHAIAVGRLMVLGKKVVAKDADHAMAMGKLDAELAAKDARIKELETAIANATDAAMAVATKPPET